MFIIIGYVKFFIEEASSLKDRRNVVKSVLRSLKNRFNISLVEWEDGEDFHYGKIGISAICNGRSSVNSLKEKIINFIDSYYPGRICNYSFQIEDIGDFDR